MNSSHRKKTATSPHGPARCSRSAKSSGNRRRRRVPVRPASAAGAVGILGGIFDPVHNGHLAAAGLARDYFCLSRILFIPCGRPAHKACPGATAAQRLAMLRLAIRGERKFALWDGELRRTGVSYTFDTLARLTRELPGRPLYFIVGSDNLGEIVAWHRYREVLGMVTLCVAHRPGHATVVPPELRGARIVKFPSPESAVSSTLVREYCSRGFSCRFMVPDTVWEYISRKGLYTQ
jgi:nicotinate-nucleotide adenylyltransferase